MSIGRGSFITIEGGDGAGKSTHLAFIGRLLDEYGIKHIQTREPGGTPIGERIRELVLDSKDEDFGDDTELLLIFAARMEHLQKIIRPAMESGTWVVCDRFTDASYAYQGGGRGMDPERIRVLESWVQQGLQPDLTIVLDVPVDVGRSRADARGSDSDRFESQADGFKEAVRQAYLDRVAEDPVRMQIVDAAKAIPDVQKQIRTVIHSLVAQG